MECSELQKTSRNRGLTVSPGLLLSVVCLVLYSAGFVRVELKFDDQDQRLEAVEEAIALLKFEMKTYIKGTVMLKNLFYFFPVVFVKWI